MQLLQSLASGPAQPALQVQPARDVLPAVEVECGGQLMHVLDAVDVLYLAAPQVIQDSGEDCPTAFENFPAEQL